MNLISQRIEGYLKANTQYQSVVIWGSGQIGFQVYNLIKNKFKHIQLLGFIDTNAQEIITKNEYTIYPKVHIGKLNPDLVIIASIAYEGEIYDVIKNEFPNYKNRIYTISEINTTDSKLNQILQLKEPYEMKIALFDYPDSPELWLALSKNESTPDLKHKMLECAERLFQERSK